ncbi:MAG: DUF4040 domain-containing protein [Pseudomonadota bacterium]|nr:DUF4040 domain-containing protein [Pseudomonadota bacterium]
MNLAFDLLLIAALLWSAGRALTTPDLFRAVVLFIVFGLLMALAWARLDAPDIALAEAAIGAGLTGALLLDALGHLRGPVRRKSGLIAPSTVMSSEGAGPPAFPTYFLNGLAIVLAVALGLALAGALLLLPEPAISLPREVAAAMDASGVAHPVTAVLLNFRGYDTLLEVAVLWLALLGVLAVAGGRAPGRAPVTPRSARASLKVPRLLARVLAPLALLVAGYLLWAGAHQPGGAFQAGAVLAAAAVLLNLAGLLPGGATPRWVLRAGLGFGLLVFLAVAAAVMGQGVLLQYPPAWAGALIMLIETGLTLSIGLTLAGLFLALSGASRQ